ncbi:MAG: hypothetical protein D6689_07230 [Deltaproteobacteria bacterium]|nr:MAG: hypothetical protein D6689_07230 [Deltaproteobacteria bacterium]
MRAAAIGVVIATAALAPVARASEPGAVRAEGRAPAGAPDARAAALDRAFAEAVRRAVAARVEVGERARHAGAVDAAIAGRAREFVARYQVVAEGPSPAGYFVQIDVWVDDAALARALADAGIAPAAPAVDIGVGRPPLALVALVRTPDAAVATFGRDGGDGGPLGRAVDRELRELGFRPVRPAPGTSPPAHSVPGAALPVDDAAARAFALAEGAGGAVVIAADLESAGRIRGTPFAGAQGRARVRVVAADGAAIADAAVEAGAYAEAANDAVDACAAQLGRRAVAAVRDALRARWPAGVIDDDAVIVELRGAPSWAPVRAVQRALAAAPGVSSVTPRRLAPGAVALAVATRQPAARIAEAAGRAAFDPLRAEVHARSDALVEIVLQAPTVPAEGPP